MNVLVTGDRGFLGRHLCKRLIQAGFSVYRSNTKTANLSNYENLSIFKGIKFDIIFHLAAKTKAGDYCLYNSGTQWIENQTINTNILRFWKEQQPQAKMIAMGTSCSYAPDKELTESNYLLGEPDDGLYTYAMTKRMLLVGLMSLKKQYGMDYCYYIPSTIYGPNYDPEDNHFIFDLIRKIKDGLDGEEVELWGDGSQKRELIHVDDVVNIIFNTMSESELVLNLGTGVSYSIKEYAEMISEFVGYNPALIKYNTEKYVGVKDKRLDTTKMKSYYNKDLVQCFQGIKSLCKR